MDSETAKARLAWAHAVRHGREERGHGHLAWVNNACFHANRYNSCDRLAGDCGQLTNAELDAPRPTGRRMAGIVATLIVAAAFASEGQDCLATA
jgi:hypothetical protein